MKILIITGIFPPDIGGPATYVPQVATGLAQRGHQVTVLTLSDHIDYDDRGYPFQVVRLSRRQFKLWRWLYTVICIVREGRNAGVLFINGLALEASVANFLLRKPMVLKVIGDFAWERARGRGWVEDDFEDFQKKHYDLKVEALKALRAWWTRRADRVITPSRYLANWIGRWGVPEEKIITVYNAVESPGDLPPVQIPLQTSLKVVTVSRLVPWKRIDKVIEVIAGLDGTGLVIVGDGPERGRLEKLATALGVTDRIYFTGARCKEETLAFMAACDVFVLNSIYEGLPHVVLEAMILGLPVVATAVGGTPEVVEDGHNGLLIEPARDISMLRKALLTMFRPYDRLRFIDGVQETSTRFALERMIDDTENILMSVVKG
ncbi:Glycosyl transferase, family 1 [Moorella glycerini]|uniref:GDP-mannose-dependent alpha-(1-6)-phosphatidylinositol monomannoside mannosyltransferase n=1 Tax=Neomoorella stamsii TaxID=1266720 RepID=A0A9X7J574_9FIRM|nr:MULTISPECIES: glycosyltransferase family 4 protein [Moorella]PRR77053.1 GDP-mannose-dependent alpha-(1-6)-phosphatidylinositol monomannoside mannosyltransferase [Moorella stamsii]CEP68828.1 Glycosyl transferase, family 1 [Moorella glycerini]